MPIDSLIRLRQLNKQEVSGYAVEIIKQYLLTGTGISVSSTGSLSGSFYPLGSNPSGYLTGLQSELIFSSDTGNLVDTSLLAFTQSTILSQVGGLYYPKSNPSGFITRSTGDALYVQYGPVVNTEQVIFDDNVAVGYSIDFNPNKWFFLRGTGNAIIDFYNTTGAKITGFSVSSNDIKLNGKTVLNDASQFINVLDYAPNTGLVLRDNVKAIFPMEYRQHDGFGLRGVQGAMIDFYDSGRSYNRPFISGFDLLANNIYIDGTIFTGYSNFATFPQLSTASGILNDYVNALNEYTVAISGYFEKHLAPTGVVDWDKRWLLRSGGKPTLDWQSGVIYDLNDNTVINWNSGERFFFNNSGEVVMDLNDYYLLISGIISADWSGRGLYDSEENKTIDWENRYLHGPWSGDSFIFSGTTGFLTKEVANTLYYAIGNPSNYTNQAYVDTKIANLTLLKGNVDQNTSVYFYDNPKGYHSFVFEGGTDYYLSGGLNKNAIIDLYGTTHSDFVNQPYISGFDITGANNLWVKNLYLDGQPIIEALSGQNSGNSLSKFDDRHNTRMVLWNTGSNTTGMFFSGGNGPYFLQFYYRYPNGALEYKNKIDIRNSQIDGYGFTNVNSFTMGQGAFGLFNSPQADWAFLYDRSTNNYYLKSNTGGAYIDLWNNVISGFNIAGISGFSVNGIKTGNVIFTGTGGTEVTTSGNIIYISGGAVINTGELTQVFYPLTGNPSGFVTSGETGIYSSQFYPLNSNPSGYVQSSKTGGFLTSDTVGGVRKVSVSGSSISGDITITGVGGLEISRSGQVITISGGTSNAGVSNENLTIISNPENLTNNSLSTQYIQFTSNFNYTPVVVGSIVNDSGDGIHAYTLSGISISGFYVNTSDAISTSNYKFNYIALGQTTGGQMPIWGTISMNMSGISAQQLSIDNTYEYWSFEESNGDNPSGRNIGLTFSYSSNSIPTYTGGLINNSFIFTGSGTHSILCNLPQYTSGSGFSLNYWVRHSYTGGIPNIQIALEFTGVTVNQSIDTYPTHSSGYSLIGDFGNYQFRISDSCYVQSTGWIMNTYTYNGSSGEHSYYLNGALVGKSPTGRYLQTATPELSFSASRNFSVEVFTGYQMLDEIYVSWNKTLSAEEVSYLYNSGSGRSFGQTGVNTAIPYIQCQTGTGSGTGSGTGQSPQTGLLSGIISYWKLNESSSTRFDSVTYSANDLTPAGTLSTVSGKIISGVDFSAGELKCTSSNVTGFDFQYRSMTFTAWVQVALSNANMVFAGYSNTPQWYLGYGNTAGQLYAVLRRPDSNVEVFETAGLAWALNEWHFVRFSYQNNGASTRGDMIFQVDNGSVFSGQTSVVNSTLIARQNDDFRLGRYVPNTNYDWQGKIDDVGVWERVLTSGELTTLYNNGSGKAHPFS